MTFLEELTTDARLGGEFRRGLDDGRGGKTVGAEFGGKMGLAVDLFWIDFICF